MAKLNKNKQNQGSGKKGPIRVTTVNPRTNIASRTIVTKTVAPRIRSTTDGCVVRNEEMFGTIIGAPSASTTTIASLSLNPCNYTVFPWLSNIAVRYSLYRVRKLRVHLNSVVPTTVTGSATIGGFYDREDLLHWNALGTTITLSQTPKASSGPVWSSALSRGQRGITSDIMYEFDANRAHVRVPWFKCDANPTGDTEFNQSVGCHLGVAVDFTGLASQLAVQVWFEYEIEFLHPSTSLNNISVDYTLEVNRTHDSSDHVLVGSRPTGDRIFPPPTPAPLPDPMV